MAYLSIEVNDKETASILKELRKKGINVSDFVCKAIKNRAKARHTQ